MISTSIYIISLRNARHRIYNYFSDLNWQNSLYSLAFALSTSSLICPAQSEKTTSSMPGQADCYIAIDALVSQI